MLFRSLCVTMGDAAALSLIKLTRPRASANAWRGVSHPAVPMWVAAPAQQRQKCRRDNKSRLANPMAAVSGGLVIPGRS